MKRIIMIVLLLIVLLPINDIKTSASPVKLNIGIASSESSAYGEMISLLSRSSYLQIIERKDLAPLFKELELKQTGAVLGASDSRLKGIDYLIMLDKNQNQYNSRIVKVETGEIVVGWTDSIDVIAERCIEKLEAEVNLRSIAELKNDQGFKVSINFSKESYKIGDRIEFTITSEDTSGYLYLIDIQPDGSVVVLLPNRQKDSFKIEKGEKILIPEALGFNIKASGPVGTDKLIAVVTKKPIDIFKFGLNAGDNFTEVSGKTKGTLSRGMNVELIQLPAKDWGISSATIVIKK